MMNDSDQWKYSRDVFWSFQYGDTFKIPDDIDIHGIDIPTFNSTGPPFIAFKGQSSLQMPQPLHLSRSIWSLMA